MSHNFNVEIQSKDGKISISATDIRANSGEAAIWIVQRRLWDWCKNEDFHLHFNSLATSKGV